MATLGAALPMWLGGDAPISDDWPTRLRGRLYAQFRDKAWAISIANAIGAQRGQLEALFQALLSLWSIDPTVTDETDAGNPAFGVGRGEQLDRIGALVGQRRGAASDAEYRPILRARILASKSNGSGDSVIGVFVAMLSSVGAPLITPGWIAQFTVRLVGVVMDPLVVTAALSLLRACTQGGTRSVLEWTTVAPAKAATFNATGPNQGWGDATNSAIGGALGGAAAP